MASIKLTELRPAGSELFNDSESFLNELNDQDMSTLVTGGFGGSSTSWGWGVDPSSTGSLSSLGSSGSFNSIFGGSSSH